MYYTNDTMQTIQRPMPLGNFKKNSETLPELIETNFSKKRVFNAQNLNT